MKLTSTLLAAAVAAGLCSTVANADFPDFPDFPVYDTFEQDQTWPTRINWWDDGSAGSVVTPTGGTRVVDFWRDYQDPSDNVLRWVSSGDNDESVITNAAGWAGSFSGTVPCTNKLAGAPTSAQYLVLDTNGDTLSRKFTAQTFEPDEDSSIFVDTMIQFTASDGEPTDLGANGAHIALWLDKDTSNLVAYCGCYVDETFTATNCVIASEISTATWYRLTIHSRHMDSMLFFRIAVNENWAESSEFAYSEYDVLSTGETDKQWFLSAKSSTTLSEVAFQGTGAVDNLTVTTDSPDFMARSASVALTLTWDSTIASVVQGGDTLTSPAEIDSGSEITISAAIWYALNSAGTNITGDVTLSGITGNGTTFGSDYTNLTVTLTATDVANPAAEIKAALYSDGTITAGAATGVDAGKAAKWATGNNISTIEGFTAKYQQYLLNADANAEVAFTIESIETTASGATITVKATADGTDITAAYNGTVKYQAAGSIAGLAGATKETAADIVFDENGIGTFTVPNTAGQFVRAWVE